MCITPIKIYNNSHYLWKNGYEQYQISVPCGECTECIRNISNEYKLRTYYEYLDTDKNNGFTIYDTLTYDNENLPTLQKLYKNIPDKYNCSCLNYNDIRELLTRLNSNIKRKYGKIEYKHIITGEYGENEEYTHRPHYHALFFIKSKKITPSQFSREIKNAWKKGRTCGIDDEPNYFINKGIIKGKENALRVSDYIGKYCLKNQKHDKEAKKRTEKIMELFYQDENNEKAIDIFKKPEWRKRRNEMLKNIKTFHKQSHHFGESALNYQRNKEEIQNDFIGMPDQNQLWVKFKIPMYYKRKLFYKQIKDKYNQRHWIITTEGIQHILNNKDNKIKQYENNLIKLEKYSQSTELINDINTFNKDNKKTSNPIDIWNDLNDRLYSYRNGRKWQDFILYKLYYQNRISEGNYLKAEDIITQQQFKANEQCKEIYYNYCTISDKDYIGHRTISINDHGNKWKGYINFKGIDEKRPKQFLKDHCINENCIKYEDFDKLDETINTINQYKEHQNFKLWTHLRELKQRDKQRRQKITVTSYF